MDVIIASDYKEIGVLQKANIAFDLNNKKEFTVQIARCYYNTDLTFLRRIYALNTEYGGLVGRVNTNTGLDYVELKGFTWRGMLDRKIIEPPSGSDYKVVSGELHAIMKSLIEPQFDDLFKVSIENTGVNVYGFQFDRYCSLYDGLVKMLESVQYKLRIMYRKSQKGKGYVEVSAVPIIDFSNQIEMSNDIKLNFVLQDKKDGINHLICLGKGELQAREVIHLYVQKDGSIGMNQYYKGREERTAKYENTGIEAAELKKEGIKKLKELSDSKTFKISDAIIADQNLRIGDIVGGRDYLTGLYAAKPIENISYSIINGRESYDYKLKGDGKNENNYRTSREATCYSE